MSTKSISPGPELESFLKKRKGVREDSAAINAAVGAYEDFVRENMPQLSWREWVTLFDALHGNSFLLTGIRQAAQGIPFGLSDSFILDGLDEKWKINGSALVDKVGSMTLSQRMAIIDASWRFWRNPDPQSDSWREEIESIVGKTDD